MKKKFIFIVTSILLIAMVASMLVFLPACNTATGNESDQTTKDDSQKEEQTYNVSPIRIGILADIQLMPEEYLLELNTKKYIDYLDNTGNFKMPELTEAIYKTSVDELIESDVDVAFLIGDLTNDGSVLGMEIIAEGCAKLEAAGIPTFVTNGLWDVNHYRSEFIVTYKTTNNELSIDDIAPVIEEDEFVEMFADYGYGEALSRDSHSLSYAADIPGTNYRLIVVDGASFYEQDPGTHIVRTESTKMPKGEMEWIEQALLDAKATAKEPLVITNIPVNPKPLSYFTDFIADAHLTMQEGADLEALFAENGVKYVFSGHYHINSELEVATEQGTLTEIYTSNTCTYPCTIRYFNINSDYSYNTERALIEKLDTEYLTNTNIPQDEKVAASTGFVAYSKLRVNRSLEQSLHANMYRKDAEGNEMFIHFFVGLDIYPSEDKHTNEVLEEINDKGIGWMLNYNNMPLYGIDGTTETVESICAEYGLTLPNSRYAGHTTKEFIFNLIYRIFDGTFLIEETEIDSVIFTRIFQAGLVKFAELKIFDSINEIEPMVVQCDMFKVVDNFMETGIIDLKIDNFLLAVFSLLFPTIKKQYHIDLSSVKDISALLDMMDIIMPVLSAGIPDLQLFCNEEGKFEREDCYSLKNGTINGKNFIEYIMFSVLVRTVLIL